MPRMPSKRTTQPSRSSPLLSPEENSSNAKRALKRPRPSGLEMTDKTETEATGDVEENMQLPLSPVMMELKKLEDEKTAKALNKDRVATRIDISRNSPPSPQAAKSPEEKRHAKAIANMTKLWWYLKSPNRPSVQDSSSPHLQIVKLPEGLRWPLGINVFDTLFVRPSQQKTLNRILKTYKKSIRNTGIPVPVFEDGISDDEDEDDEDYEDDINDTLGFIVKGTPGIGTTAFLNLLVYYAAQMDVDVVLHNAPYWIFVLHRNGTVKFVPKDHIEKVAVLSRRETLYLFNPDEQSTQASLSRAFTVIASSPDEKHYSNFTKLPNMNVLFLFPWTREEARAALQALQPTRKLSAKQIATLNKRFDEVGGSLRYLTYPRGKYNEVKPKNIL